MNATSLYVEVTGKSVLPELRIDACIGRIIREIGAPVGNKKNWTKWLEYLNHISKEHLATFA